MGTRDTQGWVYLPDAWKQAPVRISEHPVAVTGAPATPKRPGTADREATVEVRSARVRILRGPQWRKRHCAIPWVEVWAVWVREIDPPEGVEPLTWLLLTTLEAGTATSALQVVEIYRRRWQIEGLHRVLKSGLRVERLQIDDKASLMNALALHFVVAWRILQLTYQARVTPEVAPDAWLHPSELAVLTAHFHRPPSTLREALQLVARYGGWPGATRAAMPGAEVLWRGFRDLAVAVRAWESAIASFHPPPVRDTS
jgi:hypothetical protein